MQPSNNPTFELLEKVYSYLMADLKEDLFNARLYSCVNKLNTMGCNIISILTNSCLPFNKSEKAFSLTLSERLFILSLILYILKG